MLDISESVSGLAKGAMPYQSSWTRSILRERSECARLPLTANDVGFRIWCVLALPFRPFRCRMLLVGRWGEISSSLKATLRPVDRPSVLWMTVGVSLSGPSPILDTSYCRMELSWLRPKRLSATEDALLLVVPSMAVGVMDDDSGGGRDWSHNGLWSDVNDVSRHIFLAVQGVTIFGGPPETEIVGLCAPAGASTRSEVIDELALDDWRCGFRGPKVVITYRRKCVVEFREPISKCSKNISRKHQNNNIDSKFKIKSKHTIANDKKHIINII